MAPSDGIAWRCCWCSGFQRTKSLVILSLLVALETPSVYSRGLVLAWKLVLSICICSICKLVNLLWWSLFCQLPEKSASGTILTGKLFFCLFRRAGKELSFCSWSSWTRYSKVKSVAHWLCLSITRKVPISPVSGCAEGSPRCAVPGEVPAVAGRRGVSVLGGC